MAKNSIKNKISGISLYYKFFAIYGLTFAILIISLTLTTNIDSKQFQKSQVAELNQLGEYLVEDIGIPPNLNKAQEAVDKFAFYLTIKGPNLDWKDSKTPNFSREISTVVEKEGYSFYFTRKSVPLNYFNTGTFLVLFFLLPLLLLLSNLTVGYLLNPLKSLVEATKKIGSGNYEFEFESENSDEIGELTRSFQKMSAKIQSQIEDMRTLLVGIAHEFKTPLTRLHLNLEAVSDEKIKDSILRDLKLINKMIDSILEQHRLGLGLEHLDLAPINFHSLAKTFALENEIRFKSESQDFLVEVDSKRIELVLSNLLVNAKRYGKEPFNIELKKSNEYVLLSFWDEGNGLKFEDLESLTQPFFRLDGARTSFETPSTGLGLSLVASVIKAHRGKLELKLTNKSGLLIEIKLPLFQD